MYLADLNLKILPQFAPFPSRVSVAVDTSRKPDPLPLTPVSSVPLGGVPAPVKVARFIE